jgi:hypothetical protein
VVNKRLLLGILAMALVFGMTVVGCDEGSNGGGNNEKTLIIQNIPAKAFAYGESGGLIGVFPTGTTPEQAMMLTGLVAGADLENFDIIVVGNGPYTMTVPLYDINYNRWTGKGTFDIYVALNGGGEHYYRVSSVNISSETTYIPFSSGTEIFP